MTARAAAVDAATLDDFDALCAHLATMHPSRYLALIEGVSAVFITGVHALDDQSVALRLVALTDRLYDAGIPVVASGRSWTPSSARRCWRAGTARSICAPRRACSP